MEKTQPVQQDNRTAAELEERIALLEEELAGAQEANLAKSRFLSSMSHDIRTPMNAILGMTAIALSHIDEKARVQDCLNKIQTASSHLMDLVNDVLDMSRIDSGRLTLSEEEFSLADLAHEVAVIVRPQAAQKRQSLTLEMGEILEEELVGDPLRLRQIVVNIVGNAVKYTQEEGSIELRLSQRRAAQNGQPAVWLDFQCQDNGMGMSPEFVQRIFLPFERVHSDRVSKIEGTGLGMSIVKNLVDQMGGDIRVESQEDVGSLFSLSIPLPVSQSAHAPALPQGKTVLVADAEDSSAGQVQSYLENAGLEVVRTTAGLETVTRLTEAKYEGRMPCALLLGQELDDMPPLNLASHVRELAGNDFPMLLLSQENWAEVEYQATRAGISAFVPRPLFKSRLLGALSQLVGGGQAADGGCAAPEADYSGSRVLLVEDNELNREIATELLGMTGVQVETAGDGAQAVEMFQNAPEGHYDLIFMDVQMPVMDGYEATRRIRAMPRADAGEVWIVAMTANAFVEDMRRSRQAGMNEHISKPVDLERLRGVLSRQLKPRREGM